MESNPEEKPNEGQNLALIETHLQVSNVLKILFTINPNILNAIVELTPENLRDTTHYKIIKTTLEYYQTIFTLQQEEAKQKEEEKSNIITPPNFHMP